MRMPSASQVRSAVGGNDFAPASADHPAPMHFSVAATGEEAPRGMRVWRRGGKRHVGVVGVEHDKIKASGVSLFEARSGEFEK